MQITIKYFGMLAEVTNCQEETLDEKVTTVLDVLNILYSKHPLLKTKNFQVAQNQVLVAKETLLTQGELALLPPFAGG